MSTTKNVAFRSSISGYNREDVNTYILDMTRMAEERENELRTQLDSANAALQEESRAAAGAIDEANAVISALRESVEQLKEHCAQLEEQLSAEKETTQTLQAELEKRSTLELDNEKSKKYDQISAQIGELMINANQSADKIIAAANAEAQRIRAETEEEAITIRAHLSGTADAMLTSLSGRLHASTEDCITEITTVLHEMRDSASSLIRDMEARSEELNDKIEFYQSNVANSIEDSLAEMDEKYGIRPDMTGITL